MNPPSGPSAYAILRRTTGLACAGASACALMVLAGWLFGVPSLTSGIHGYPLMNPVTAICILLASAALWVKRSTNPGGIALRVANLAALLVASIGAARLATVLSGVELHADQWLFRAQVLASTAPARMVASTSIACACLGLALVTLDLRMRDGARPAYPLIYAALGVSLLGLIGYIYAAPALHGLMAAPTAIAFLFLSVATLLARPDRGLCAQLLRESPGGTLARRVLPAAVLVPLVLAWVRLEGQRAGLYSLEVGTALLALVIVAVLVCVVHVVGRRLDVADGERSRAEHELRRSLARQSLILDANVIGILTANSQHLITEANQAFLDMIGYEREDLPLKWETITPPEWHGKTEVAKREISERGIITPFEKEYLRKDGRRVPVLIGAAALPGPEGDAVAFVVDLSGKRSAEFEIERISMFLDSIVENLPNMIFVKDAKDLRFVRFNRAGEELVGVSREALIGKNDYDLFPKEQADFFTAKDRAVIESRQLLDISEEPLQTVSGETRILHTKKVPIIDAEGVPRYLLGISEDITARKAVEREVATLNEGLRKRTQELELANKELESFSYSVSHDLRAPLRHIDGFADLLARQAKPVLNEMGLRYLDTISNSAKEMGALIDDLLAFSRMSRATMQPSAVDIGRLVSEVQAKLLPDTVGKDITWEIEPMPLLRVDPGMMRLVFMNLLSNAVKYSGRRPQARIEVGVIDEAADEIILFVRDNGVGFDMNYAHKLFGVFQRLHRDEEFEGTGIGLANVQRIIHRHGGRTWGEGEVDRGATFYVALPRDLKLEPEEAVS